MKRVAIVVQRWDADLAGGSEQLAWLYAKYLRDAGFAVDLLTTTARDAQTWADELPAGQSAIEGIQVRRFRVDGERSAYWQSLHDMLLREFETTRGEAVPLDYNFFFAGPTEPGIARIRWPVALQEEWIRFQGPHSVDLLNYIAEHHPEYDAFVFTTYLYSPAYFGLQLVPRERSILIPTLHDEAPAYLPAFRNAARGARAIIWNMPAERRLGEVLWGPFATDVIHGDGGMGIERPQESTEPGVLFQGQPRLQEIIEQRGGFALYCGRISESKGCAQMIEYFLAGQDAARTGSAARAYPESLVLTGDLQMGLPRNSSLFYAGFVSTGQKFALMARARALIMPSSVESFSIVTLEAMGQGTPVLANSASAVLQEHVTRSGAGLLYHDASSFARNLTRLSGATPAAVRALQKSARSYVSRHYAHESVRDRIAGIVRAVCE